MCVTMGHPFSSHSLSGRSTGVHLQLRGSQQLFPCFPRPQQANCHAVVYFRQSILFHIKFKNSYAAKQFFFSGLSLLEAVSLPDHASSLIGKLPKLTGPKPLKPSWSKASFSISCCSHICDYRRMWIRTPCPGTCWLAKVRLKVAVATPFVNHRGNDQMEKRVGQITGVLNS